MIWTCCDLLNELKNCYVRIIFDVVCHSDNDKHWDNGIMKHSYGGIYCLWCDLEWLLWELWWLWLWYLQGWDCNLDLLCLYPSWWWCLEIDLVWYLVLESCLCWWAVVPEGGIQCGQSTTMWSYSLHSNNVHLDNDLLCDLTPDISNIGLPHRTLHSQ